MWNNFASGVAAALERTGDALTERATAHVRKQAEESGSREEQKREDEKTSSSDGSLLGTRPTMVALPPTASEIDEKKKVSPQSEPQLFMKWTESVVPKFGQEEKNQKGEDVFLNLKVGWESMLVATQRAAEATREVVEKERERFRHDTAGLFGDNKSGARRRDLSLPLDADALRDAEVVYITDRIVTMGHPAMQSSTDGDLTADRKLAAVGHLLHRRHAGRFMVWNLSEVEYDYSLLDDQVLTYKFPGSPSPPLGLLMKLLLSLESWLRADERNVAVLHCLTGRGRTSTVLAAFLCWTGEAGFRDPNAALEYVARCKRLDPTALTIPSQRRYASYFSNMLDGVRPNQPPLLLKRIIMNEAPRFGKRPKPTNENTQTETSLSPNRMDDDDARNDPLGCAPYLQIFKAGNLVFTAAPAAATSYSKDKGDLPFCLPSDGPISFSVETIVQGDILIRCRHLTKSGQRTSMFRAAFHTGYVPPKVLRLTKAQLDGACSDKRFGDDFFLDLIFEPCDAEMASQLLLEGGEDDDDQATMEMVDIGGSLQNEAVQRRMMGTVVGATSTSTLSPDADKEDQLAAAASRTVTATAYDTMLHRDSRFWDVIAGRRRETMNKTAAAAAGDDSNKPTDTVADNKERRDPSLYGPTIGRRRDFTKSKSKLGNAEDATISAKGDGGTQSSSQKGRTELDAFSIGVGFDVLDEDETPAAIESQQQQPPKKDELMEALMALDDETASPSSSFRQSSSTSTDHQAEEIVFESATEANFLTSPTTAKNKSKELPAAEASPNNQIEEGNFVSQNKPNPSERTLETSTTEESGKSEEGEVSKNREESKPAAAIVPTSTTTEEGSASADSKDNTDTPTPNALNQDQVTSTSNSTAPAEEQLFDDTDDDDVVDGADEDFDYDDEDDDELEDLENFLTKASGK